ncbi:hypothetical protein EBU71_04150 [bacterium]|nr:hypothetical protein [Candidatus Elulimicrobium humile]
MKKILLIGSLMFLGACAGNLDKLNQKTQIEGNEDLIKAASLICNEYKSTDSVLYGCGSGVSSDLELSKSKAILQAKISVADVISNSLVKNETLTTKESTKDGVSREYNSSEKNQIFEQSLNRYKVVYDKQFTDQGRFRSFIVIEYKLKSL